MVFNESQVLIYRFFRVAFSLEQDGTCTFRHLTNEFRYVFKALNGAQGLIVHHFCGDNLFTAHISERYNRKGCIVQCFEEHEAAAFIRHVFNRVVHHFRYEAQCTFRADEQMVDDVNNIFKINEGVQAVTCCIFNFIFVMNQMRQFFVSQDFFAQLQEIFYHLRFFFEELIDTFLVGRIKNRAVQ